MSDLGFKEQLKLDKYNLDDCAIEQPDLYAEWGIKWADAVDVRDRQKDFLAVVRSECDYEIRATPSEFGWEKLDKAPTEAFISAAIPSHPSYKEANEAYLEACHDVNILVIAKDAFEQRRKMIEVLQQLYSGNYFSSNKEMDKGYKTALEKASVNAQNEGLESSPRLLRRKVKELQ